MIGLKKMTDPQPQCLNIFKHLLLVSGHLLCFINSFDFFSDPAVISEHIPSGWLLLNSTSAFLL
jgi:hypothetical protein